MSTHRRNCRRHAEQRARERRFPAPIERIEDLCRRMAPAYAAPGRDRYLLTVRGGGWRRRVVYDTAKRCIVTVYEGDPGGPAL